MVASVNWWYYSIGRKLVKSMKMSCSTHRRPSSTNKLERASRGSPAKAHALPLASFELRHCQVRTTVSRILLANGAQRAPVPGIRQRRRLIATIWPSMRAESQPSGPVTEQHPSGTGKIHIQRTCRATHQKSDRSTNSACCLNWIRVYKWPGLACLLKARTQSRRSRDDYD